MTDADQIRNTIARNNQLLDDRHYEECANTFAEDGSIAIGPHSKANGWQLALYAASAKAGGISYIEPSLRSM